MQRTSRTHGSLPNPRSEIAACAVRIPPDYPESYRMPLTPQLQRFAQHQQEACSVAAGQRVGSGDVQAHDAVVHQEDADCLVGAGVLTLNFHSVEVRVENAVLPSDLLSRNCLRRRSENLQDIIERRADADCIVEGITDIKSRGMPPQPPRATILRQTMRMRGECTASGGGCYGLVSGSHTGQKTQSPLSAHRPALPSCRRPCTPPSSVRFSPKLYRRKLPFVLR